jgi:hypothetical protein
MGRRAEVPTTVMASVLPVPLADRVKAEAEESGRNRSQQIRSIIQDHFTFIDSQAGEPR